MSADVAMPLRRRWGAADGPECGRAACEPFAFEGSFDGVAPRRDGDSSNLWSGSSWFTGGAAVEAVPSGEAAAPGGAARQRPFRLPPRAFRGGRHSFYIVFYIVFT
jgi:hypothetical protein